MRGVVISRRPIAVVLRERWEQSMVRAMCRRDLETVTWLVRVYSEFEKNAVKAVKAGRN